MEISKFKIGDLYRICPKCKEKVPADQTFCDKDGCNGRLNMSRALRITQEDLNDVGQDSTDKNQVTSSEKQDFMDAQKDENCMKMKCAICDKIVSADHTVCPTCNTPTLSPYIEDENLVDKESEKQIETDQKEMQQYEYPREFISFPGLIEVYRFDANKKRIKADTILPITRAGIIFGRRTLVEKSLFYHQWTQELIDNYNAISVENIKFFVLKGELYVQKITEQKSKVVIYRKNPIVTIENVDQITAQKQENELDSTEEIVLSGLEILSLCEGDCIHLGNFDDVTRHLELVVHLNHELLDGEKPAASRKTGYTQIIKKLKESVEQVAETVDSVKESVDSVKAEFEIFKIDMREKIDALDTKIFIPKRDELLADYVKRADLAMDQNFGKVNERGAKDAVRAFLQFKDQNGNVKDCYKEFETALYSKQLEQYFYYAMFAEQICNSMKDQEGVTPDYSLAVNAIGRIFEQIIMWEVLPILRAADNAELKAAAKKRNLSENHYEQGFIMYYIFPQKNYKLMTELSDSRIRKMLTAVGKNPQDKAEFKKLRRALEIIQKAAQFRNKGSHAGASSDTSEEGLNEYKTQNKVKAISYEKYKKDKELFFSARAIETIHEFYKYGVQHNSNIEKVSTN